MGGYLTDLWKVLKPYFFLVWLCKNHWQSNSFLISFIVWVFTVWFVWFLSQIWIVWSISFRQLDLMKIKYSGKGLDCIRCGFYRWVLFPASHILCPIILSRLSSALFQIRPWGSRVLLISSHFVIFRYLPSPFFLFYFFHFLDGFEFLDGLNEWFGWFGWFFFIIIIFYIFLDGLNGLVGLDFLDGLDFFFVFFFFLF